MATTVKPLAVVTGGSSGIGYELALQCVGNGFDVIIAADTAMGEGARELQARGGKVELVDADLANREGVDKLLGECVVVAGLKNKLETAMATAKRSATESRPGRDNALQRIAPGVHHGNRSFAG